jgi:hypothetical protein
MMHFVFYWLARAAARQGAARARRTSRARWSSMPQLLVLESPGWR